MILYISNIFKVGQLASDVQFPGRKFLLLSVFSSWPLRLMSHWISPLHVNISVGVLLVHVMFRQHD